MITELLCFLFILNNLHQNISLLHHHIKRLHTWMKTLQRLERSSANLSMRCSFDKIDSIFVIHELTKT